MANRSINSNSVTITHLQRKAASENKRASTRLSAPKLGLNSTCADSSKFAADGKRRQLLHTDSGYISPTVSSTSNGNSPQTPSSTSKGLQNVNFQLGGTVARAPTSSSCEEPATKLEESDSSSYEDLVTIEQNHSADTETMQSMIAARSRESHTAGDHYEQRSLPVESPMDSHDYIQDDLLLLAYECRQANMGGWSMCQHPYCAFIRQMSEHFNSYRNNHDHTCERCSIFAEMLNKHIVGCSNHHCPIQMCRTNRHQRQLFLQTSTTAHFQFGGRESRSAPTVERDSAPRPGQTAWGSNRAQSGGMRTLERASSFSAADVVEGDGHLSLSSTILSKGLPLLLNSMWRANLRSKAEEIVNRLDQEEPLLSNAGIHSMPAQQPTSLLIQQNQQLPSMMPPNSLPTHSTHQGGPMSLPSNNPAPSSSSSSYHPTVMGGGAGQQIMLSPIAEQPGGEDISPGYSSVAPTLVHYGSQTQFSSLGSVGLSSGLNSAELDGPGGQTSMGTADSVSVNPSKTLELTQFPKQTLLHGLNPDYLTVGTDNYYYKIRDYNSNEADILGSGGFGSCLCAQDLTTNKLFAIKQNKNEDFKSIRDECHVLSRLADNDYIIRFLGAVIDDGELPRQPTQVCKMMMELAENGNLAEMLKDESGIEAPLPQNQSLYYLQQILEGVNFLHQSGYLHLDIKAQNVLVFDGGRTVKLTDFGTAVAVGEVTSMKGLKGCTPFFAAPEMIKEEVPKFSADIWSVLCVLVQMLTARLPGCHQVDRNDVQMMYLIGNYEDHKMSDLISLDKLDVDDEVKHLFTDVFRKDPQSRPGAIELLNRPIIRSAVEYGQYFDEYYDSEDAEELEADNISISAEVSQHISLGSSGDRISLHSLGDKVGDLPSIPCGNPLQHCGRVSQDSGVGADMENSIGGVTGSVFGAQISVRSLSSGSNRGSGNQQIFLHQDSGMEEMLGGECSQPGVFNVIPVHHVDIPPINHNPFCRQHSGSLHKSGGIQNVSFSSLPQAPPPQADYVMVQRSYSFGGRSATKRPDSLSRSQNRTAGGLSHIAKRHRPNSIHPKLHNLTHSQSAPSISFVGPWRKRSHSLQHLDSWEADTEADGVNLLGRPQLRRTSSEVYVDRGPDIDTPEKEKNRIQELLSSLTLGSSHPPSSSTPIPARRQTSDAGIQCDAQSATSSLSGSSMTSNETTDSKKRFDESGDHDDDHPAASGSQAFQQIC